MKSFFSKAKHIPLEKGKKSPKLWRRLSRKFRAKETFLLAQCVMIIIYRVLTRTFITFLTEMPVWSEHSNGWGDIFYMHL